MARLSDGSSLNISSSSALSPSHVATLQSPSSSHALPSRYLGEVSDVWFFNSVKGVLQSRLPSAGDDLGLESYERETGDPLESIGNEDTQY